MNKKNQIPPIKSNNFHSIGKFRARLGFFDQSCIIKVWKKYMYIEEIKKPVRKKKPTVHNFPITKSRHPSVMHLAHMTPQDCLKKKIGLHGLPQHI